MTVDCMLTNFGGLTWKCSLFYSLFFYVLVFSFLILITLDKCLLHARLFDHLIFRITQYNRDYYSQSYLNKLGVTDLSQVTKLSFVECKVELSMNPLQFSRLPFLSFFFPLCFYIKPIKNGIASFQTPFPKWQ